MRDKICDIIQEECEIDCHLSEAYDGYVMKVYHPMTTMSAISPISKKVYKNKDILSRVERSLVEQIFSLIDGIQAYFHRTYDEAAGSKE